MSGGVGPTATEIALPEDDPPAAAGLPSRRQHRRFLSFPQLNALAVVVVFASSGMVAVEDLAFAFFSLAYIYFLASYAFPSSASPSSSDAAPSFRSSRLFSVYITAGAIVGLVLPIAYIVHGVVDGDKEGIKAAAPHVFLLASQIFMEGVTFSGGFSLPMRAFVPVFYNGRRMFTIVDWLRAEIGKEEREEHGSPARVYAGRALAVVNMLFWGFNLLAFLLPVYFPWAFQTYYQNKSNGKKVK